MENFLLIGSIYVISFFLQERLQLFQKLFLPPSLIGGIILLLLGKEGLHLISFPPETIREIPSFLISFFFAGMVLSLPYTENLRKKHYLIPVLRQITFVWVIAVLQILTGFLGAFFWFGTDADYRWYLFVSFIEIGWIGGHGSASALFSIIRDLGHEDLGSFGFISATIGLLWGTGSGMVIVNILKRLPASQRDEHSGSIQETDAGNREIETAGFQLLSFFKGFLFPFFPVLAAYLLKETLFPFLSGSLLPASFWKHIPLFFLVILVSFLFRFLVRFLVEFRKGGDSFFNGIKFFSHLVLEVLIFLAIGSMKIQFLIANRDTVIFFSILGILTSIIVFLVSPLFVRLHPELSLINYGMATGTTAVGIMLLSSYRNIHALRSQKALLIYGTAAPFSAPFIGGGMISLSLPYFLLDGKIFPLFFGFLMLFFLLIIANWILNKYEDED